MPADHTRLHISLDPAAHAALTRVARAEHRTLSSAVAALALRASPEPAQPWPPCTRCGATVESRRGGVARCVKGCEVADAR